jgi:tRNA C32,U32 (ribose-2'-O)-methylase TrmJ
MYQDVFALWFVDVYFVLCIIVCSFFVLNLTIAVMLLKYEEFDKSEEGSTHLEELQDFGEQIGLPARFIEFLIEQDNINISKKGLRVLQREK